MLKSVDSADKPNGYKELKLSFQDRDLNRLKELGHFSGIAAMLSSDLSSGISTSSVPSRRMRFGSNSLPPPEQLSFFDFMKECLEDKTMQILIAAAVVSLILGMTTPDPRTGEIDRATGWIEGAAILLSVVIVVLVSALNNYQKQSQFAQLLGCDHLCTVAVVRDGNIAEIPNEEVVVGDILVVHNGMALSFDALLLEGTGYACDESSITGETEEVHKSPERDPFMVSGTNIVDGGDGIALVVAVGLESYSGEIALAIRERKSDTPLQEQLSALADVIGKFGLFAAIFTFAALFLREMYAVFVTGSKFYFMKLAENITTAVAIVVVAVPEGLPLSVTLSLAYSMKRMLSDNNLVRHLAACETMGGATSILSDKTGTMTHIDMKVVKIFIESSSFDISPSNPIVQCDKHTLQKFSDCIFLNSGCVTQNNKTTEALLEFCRIAGLTPPAKLDHSQFHRFPFSSLKKQSSAVYKDPATEHLIHHVIGASELVLSRCTTVLLGPEGRKVNLSPEQRHQYETVIEDMSKQSLRTLALAFSERSSNWSDILPHVPPEDPLCLIAIVGMQEPLRKEVPNAINVCRKAGIKVKMVTGDNLATGVSIAQQCGMLRGEPQEMEAMTGAAFRDRSDEDIIQNVIPKLIVLGRATPLDKQRLVQLMKMNASEVVAVTGDGTNDAPALKSADVGFAMNSGSDIAKQSSDIVLVDDNFVGVVRAAMWGRNVKDNIRKFLQFQLTVNLAACIVAFCGALMNDQNLSPLKPVQLLWLNLIMDTLAALGLSTELPSEQLLQRDPEQKGVSIITPIMWNNICVQSIFQLFSQILLFSVGAKFFQVKYFGDLHLSLVFNCFVMLQVFNFFNARLLRGEANIFLNLNKSYTLLYIVFLIVATQIFIIEKGGKFMSTVPLSGTQWMWCTIFGAISIPVGVLARAYQRNYLISTNPSQPRCSIVINGPPQRSWIASATLAMKSLLGGRQKDAVSKI